MHSHLVHEHQPLGVDLRGHHNPPGGPPELVSLSGASSPFLRVEPIRAMARHGGAAHRNPAYGLHVVAALPEGDEQALLEVYFEELPDSFIHLGRFAGRLSRL